MAAQDEGKIKFDDLPKAALKSWIEDFMDVSQPNAVGGLGGGGGGGTTVLVDGMFTPAVPGDLNVSDVSTQYTTSWGPIGAGATMQPIPNQSYAQWRWTKFIATKTISTIDCFIQYWQLSSATLGSDYKIMTALYDQNFQFMGGQTVFEDIDTIVGSAVSVNNEWDVARIDLGNDLEIASGFPYVLLQVWHKDMSTSQKCTVVNNTWSDLAAGQILAQGGSLTDHDDILTYGFNGGFHTTTDPTAPPSNLLAAGIADAGLDPVISPSYQLAGPWGYLVDDIN